jgi:hypothetical protein
MKLPTVSELTMSDEAANHVGAHQVYDDVSGGASEHAGEDCSEEDALITEARFFGGKTTFKKFSAALKSRLQDLAFCTTELLLLDDKNAEVKVRSRDGEGEECTVSIGVREDEASSILELRKKSGSTAIFKKAKQTSKAWLRQLNDAIDEKLVYILIRLELDSHIPPSLRTCIECEHLGFHVPKWACPHTYEAEWQGQMFDNMYSETDVPCHECGYQVLQSTDNYYALPVFRAGGRYQATEEAYCMRCWQKWWKTEYSIDIEAHFKAMRY